MVKGTATVAGAGLFTGLASRDMNMLMWDGALAGKVHRFGSANGNGRGAKTGRRSSNGDTSRRNSFGSAVESSGYSIRTGRGTRKVFVLAATVLKVL